MRHAGASFALGAALLSGCASGGFGVMDGIMSSWVGAPLDAVIAQWGYPHGETVIAGKHLYVWDRNVTVQMPMSTTGTITQVGRTAYYNGTTTGGVVSGACRRTIEVDANDIVKSWQWEGNNCPFAEIGPYANWRRKR